MSITSNPFPIRSIPIDKIVSTSSEDAWQGIDVDGVMESIGFTDVLSASQDYESIEMPMELELGKIFPTPLESSELPFNGKGEIELADPDQAFKLPIEVEENSSGTLSETTQTETDDPPPPRQSSHVEIYTGILKPLTPVPLDDLENNDLIPLSVQLVDNRKPIIATAHSTDVSPTKNGAHTIEARVKPSNSTQETLPPLDQKITKAPPHNTSPIDDARVILPPSAPAADELISVSTAQVPLPFPIPTIMGDISPSPPPPLPQYETLNRMIIEPARSDIETAFIPSPRPEAHAETIVGQVSTPSGGALSTTDTSALAISALELHPPSSEKSGPEIGSNGIHLSQLPTKPDVKLQEEAKPLVAPLPVPVLAPKDAANDQTPASLVSIDQSIPLAPAGRSSSATNPGLPFSQTQLPESISAQISAAIRSENGGEIEIRLDPEELGRIRIVLSGKEAGMSVNVFSERPDVVELMRRHSNLLETELLEIGYRDADLSFHQESGGDQDSNQETAQQMKHVTPTEAQPSTHSYTAGDNARLDIRF
jgi:flagellar hook-length control protein FliK